MMDNNQIPNSKSQIIPNNQIPITKVLDIGYWNLFGYWCLIFGIYRALTFGIREQEE